MYSREAWIGRVAFVSEEVDWRRLRDSQVVSYLASLLDGVLIRGKWKVAVAASTFRLSPLRGRMIERETSVDNRLGGTDVDNR